MAGGLYGRRAQVGEALPGEFGALLAAQMGEALPGEFGEKRAAAIAAAGPQLMQRDPRIEDLPLAGPRVSIPAGESVKVEIEPKLAYRAKRMMLAGSLTALNGRNIGVESLQIALAENVLSRDPIPGAVFGPDATHHLQGDVMIPGVGATIRFVNPTAAPIIVQPIFVGETVPQDMHEDEAVALLRQSRAAEVALSRDESVFDLMAASPAFTLGVANSQARATLQPRQAFRARRAMAVDCGLANYSDAGQWPYPAPPPGEISIDSMLVALKEQLVSNGADTGIDAFVLQPQATHHLKGSIVKPTPGIEIIASDIGLGEEDKFYQIVFFGPSEEL